MNKNTIRKRKEKLYHGFSVGKIHRVKVFYTQSLRRIFQHEGLAFEQRINLEEGC